MVQIGVEVQPAFDPIRESDADAGSETSAGTALRRIDGQRQSVPVRKDFKPRQAANYNIVIANEVNRGGINYIRMLKIAIPGFLETKCIGHGSAWVESSAEDLWKNSIWMAVLHTVADFEVDRIF